MEMDESESMTNCLLNREPKEKTLEDKVKYAKVMIKKDGICPYRKTGYHIDYCSISADKSPKCEYLCAEIVNGNDGCEYHKCRYKSITTIEQW